MDSIIIIASVVVVLLLTIIAIILSTSGKKKKGRPRRKNSFGKKSSIEIDPEALCNRLFKLAPSELKKAKQDYMGRKVEVPTIFNSSKGSKKGNSYREVILDFQDNRNYQILGDLNMSDYKDQSWMTKEGKLKIVGTVKEINPKAITLDNIKII